MTTIICLDGGCTHCSKDGECTLARIFISDSECEQYERYLSSEDYKLTYYLRISGAISPLKGLEDQREEYKQSCCGKRLELDGFVFYTVEDDRDEDFRMTEETTGLLFKRSHLITKKDVAAKIRAYQESNPPVSELREVEKVNGMYRLLEQEDTHDQT